MKINYNIAKKKTESFLSESNVKHYMLYAPTTESYWSQNPKLLILNLEPYGYEGHHLYHVDKETLVSWLNNKKSKTVRYTMSFVSVFLNAFMKRVVPTVTNFRSTFNDTEHLSKVLDKICYYNIRALSNDVVPQKQLSENDFSGKLSELLGEELKALDADIIIISGDQPRIIANKILFPTTPFNPHSVQEIDGKIVICTKHFSRPSYASNLDLLIASVKLAVKKFGPQ